MAKRLVCCPFVREGESVSLRYLYVDSLNLKVEDVTDRLSVFDENLRNVCCLDRVRDYLDGSFKGPKEAELDLPFKFSELNSLEVFRNKEELRLKTGSEKLLYSCLLNYYRREYDGTQQHTFLSDPIRGSYRAGGVEHELTLEERVMVQNEKEEFVPETLDKGKSDAEREAEAALAQAQAEMEQAAREAEQEELEKEDKKKKRKKAREKTAESEARYQEEVRRENETRQENEARREREAQKERDAQREREAQQVVDAQGEIDAQSGSESLREEAVHVGDTRGETAYYGEYDSYRDFRNLDDVQSEQFGRLRDFEVEMRENQVYFAQEYASGNYASLPGFVTPESLAATFDSIDNETVHYTVDSNGLFAFGSRLDEFGVTYTVFSNEDDNGVISHSVCCGAADAERVIQAAEFYELEQQLCQDGVISSGAYFSAFQLQALHYAYQNYVDTSIICSGEFSGNQMLRIVEAGVQGHDISALANPGYSTPQMDALVHYLNRGWDTSSISSPNMAPETIADCIIHEERVRGIVEDDKFFAGANYDAFVGYGRDYSRFDYFNDYDSAHQAGFDAKLSQGGYSNEGSFGGQNRFGLDSGSVAKNFSHCSAGELVLHKDPAARIEAVRQGVGLELLVKDSDPYVRAAVAERGYGLETLIEDRSPVVRAAVAGRGFGLDRLVSDNAAVVRMAVARQGYGLDELVRDGGWNVKKTAERVLLAQSQGGNEAVFKGQGPRDLSGLSAPTGLPSETALRGKKGQGNESLNSEKVGQGGGGVPEKAKQGKADGKYSWGAEYTPNGYKKSDSTFTPDGPTYRRQKSNANAQEASANRATGGGAPQKAPPAEGAKLPRKKHALDELRVRATFAERAGLRLERFGSRALETGKRFGDSSVRLVSSNLVRDDETGTMSLAYRTGRNASLVAHLVADLPLMYAKTGKGVSFTYGSIQSAAGSVPGGQGQKQVVLPLRAKVWQEHIAAAEQKHNNSIKKQFGENAAYWNIKEIDKQIDVCNQNLNRARERIVPESRKLKGELKNLDSAAKLHDKKNELICENRRLKDEIQTLQQKRHRTSAEEKLLAEKLAKKSANEVQIHQTVKGTPSVKLLNEKDDLISKNRVLKKELKTMDSAMRLSDKKHSLINENRKLKDEIRTLQQKQHRSPGEEKLLAEKLKKKAGNEGLIKDTIKKTPSVGLVNEKEALIRRNQKLKQEIQALQRKKNRTSLEDKLLADKIKQKKLNEKRIGLRTNKLKERYSELLNQKKHNESLIKKKVGKFRNKRETLLKQKKLNEEILSKHGRKVKDLNRLKKKKLAFQKDRKDLNKILKRAFDAENRLKSIPGIFANKLIQKLYESGDRTFAGIGEASGYAMSIAQNPLVRLAVRSVKKIFKKKPPKAVKTDTASPKVKPKKEKLPKSSAQAKKPIRKADMPKIRKQKIEEKIANRTKRTIGQQKVANAERFAMRSKNVTAWIKQTRKRVVEAFVKATQSAAALIKGAAGSAMSAMGSFGGVAGAGGVMLFLVLIIIIVAMFGAMSGASSSFVLAKDTSDEGKIDLSHYVALVNGFQEDLLADINEAANGVSSVTGKPYDNVIRDYMGANNTKEIIIMAYVRFGFDLYSDEEAVEAYLEQLYRRANTVVYEESELYFCGDGCETREYKCYDKPDDFATTTRLSLYEASDHSDSIYVGDDKDEYLGCKYKTYSCMKKGHSIYDKEGCSKHNNGKAMKKPKNWKCDNYREKEYYDYDENGEKRFFTVYYCEGHCDEKHRDYYCPGHEETVCYGQHQDLKISVTSLGFDEIFAVDFAGGIFTGLGDIAFSNESGGNPWMYHDDSGLKDGSVGNYGLGSFTYSSGSIQKFMAYLKTFDPELYSEFDGLIIGSKDFNRKWTSGPWTAEQTQRMDTAQRSFAWVKYGVVAAKLCMEKTGVDLTRSWALMEVAVSRGLHGPYVDWYSGAHITNDMSDEEIITRLYDYMYDHVEGYFGGQTQNWRGLRNRFAREKVQLLALCGRELPSDESDSSHSTEWNGWNDETIEMVKNIYETMNSEDADEIYAGLEKIESFPYFFEGVEVDLSILDTLPEDLSDTRRNVILGAASGVGKIPYNWGGKPRGPGLDGVPAGGLDCSGFVCWAFLNAGIPTQNWYYGGTGTISGSSSMVRISHSELQPGDFGLKFVGGSSDARVNHVGIYVGKNESGVDVWVHCSGSSGATIDTYGGFTVYFRSKALN